VGIEASVVLVLVGAVPLLFPRDNNHPLCYILLLNNQQLQLHFINQLYTTIPNNTPHNTAIMPRQFFVGGNFKM
jgi:hypothetical protein